MSYTMYLNKETLRLSDGRYIVFTEHCENNEYWVSSGRGRAARAKYITGEIVSPADIDLMLSKSDPAADWSCYIRGKASNSYQFYSWIKKGFAKALTFQEFADKYKMSYIITNRGDDIYDNRFCETEQELLDDFANGYTSLRLKHGFFDVSNKENPQKKSAPKLPSPGDYIIGLQIAGVKDLVYFAGFSSRHFSYSPTKMHKKVRTFKSQKDAMKYIKNTFMPKVNADKILNITILLV